MFDLRDNDLSKPIVSCADGPAAFNAAATRRGRRVVSTDPIYVHSAAAIRSRIDDATELIVANTRTNMDAYRWDEAGSLDALVALRHSAMDEFLDDYQSPSRRARYVPGSLPSLPLASDSFGLSLCSHCLFTYSAHFSTEFHISAISEMYRVSAEARVFPLLDMDGGPSPHLGPVRRALSRLGIGVEIRFVPLRVPTRRQQDVSRTLNSSQPQTLT